MSHNHLHSCTCEHKNVRYCKHCLVVFCSDCNTEWVTKSHGYWYYPYTWTTPYTTYTTSAQDNTIGVSLPAYNLTYPANPTNCSHKEIS